MNKMSIITLAVCVASCASPPKPYMPNPKNRVPINNETSIIKYEEKSTKITKMIKENEQLQTELNGLRQQVEELKVFILKNSQHSAPPHVKPRKKIKPVSSLDDYKKRGSIDTHKSVTKYTVNHPFSVTAFLPPKEIADKLSLSAQNARKVIIKGRTDASFKNEVDKQIALDRALNAKHYLVNSCGVDIDRIRVFYLSAGDYVSDNSSEKGKALNRRVEIETYFL